MIPIESCHPGVTVYYVDNGKMIHKAMINSLSSLKAPCQYVKLNPLISYDRGGKALFSDLGLLGVPITALFSTPKDALNEISKGTELYTEKRKVTEINIAC